MSYLTCRFSNLLKERKLETVNVLPYISVLRQCAVDLAEGVIHAAPDASQHGDNDDSDEDEQQGVLYQGLSFLASESGLEFYEQFE